MDRARKALTKRRSMLAFKVPKKSSSTKVQPPPIIKTEEVES
ncbi:MAG: hypothetical protein WC664_02690 [Patescibacteria group bacterium]